MNHKERRPIEKIRNDVVNIITTAKPVFFIKDSKTEIPADELLYETRAEICTQVEMYFYKLLTTNL
jgi:hypothetical protein